MPTSTTVVSMSTMTSTQPSSVVEQLINYHDVQLYRSDLSLFTTASAWLNDNALNFYAMYVIRHVLPRQVKQLNEQSVARSFVHQNVCFMDPSVVSFLCLQCDSCDERMDIIPQLQLAHKQVICIPVTNNTSFQGISTHWSLLVLRFVPVSDYYYEEEENHSKNDAKLMRMKFEHYDSSSNLNLPDATALKNMFEEMFFRAKVLPLEETPRPGLFVPEVSQTPQQTNGYDCGMYLLLNMEWILANAVLKNAVDGGEHEALNCSMLDYVTPERVLETRQKVPEIVMQLLEAQRSHDE